MTLQNDTTSPGPRLAGGAADILEGVRFVLNRPDLTTDTLRDALATACAQPESPLSLKDFLAGRGSPHDRTRLIRCLPVPAPRHGLAMPEHDLNPPLATRMAPVRRLWLRALLSARPLIKRAPVPARAR